MLAWGAYFEQARRNNGGAFGIHFVNTATNEEGETQDQKDDGLWSRP